MTQAQDQQGANPKPTLNTDALIQAILQAVDPASAVQRHISLHGTVLRIDGRDYDLTGKDIRLIAVGKASVPMAQAMQTLLGARINRSVVVTKYGHVSQTSNVKRHEPAVNDRWSIIEAAHPVPDDNSLRAGELICEALQDSRENTLVIVCVSGGASALCVAPQPGISLKTMQAINEALLRSGADIREMNAVRSRLDRLKAGGLVRMASPAEVIGLILSDVIGDPLDVIASGLTQEAAAYNVLVGNNTQACAAAQIELGRQGYQARIVTTQMRGEARERGVEIAHAIADEAPSSALIYGGETTVTLHGNGNGGRCQELALAAASVMHPQSGSSIMAFGTDGTDGPNDAAGAIVNDTTIARARQIGLNAQAYLDNNDSYTFFEKLGDLIKTGPTGTNVADVIIALR